MIAFIDVFPFGFALDFERGNEVWLIDEQYCVEPNCNCTDSVFIFLKFPKSYRKKMTSKNAPTCRYNYHTQRIDLISPGLAGTPSIHDLMADLRGAYPNLNDQLKSRHQTMKALYHRHYQQRSEDARIADCLPLKTPAGSPKVGRNDRCPCGSGRKYKHCCLNKKPEPLGV